MSFLFPLFLELQPGALSRVCVETERFSIVDEWLWPHLSSLALRFNVLIVERTPLSDFFDLTFSDILEIRTRIPFITPKDAEQWERFGHFLDRHPHLSRVSTGINLSLDRQGMWEAFKNVSPIRPLYDAANRRGLASSFNVVKFVGDRRTSPPYLFDIYSLDVDIDPCCAVLDIVQLLGSIVPTPHLSVRFTDARTDFTLCNAVSP
jgi:hypothetical protein